MHGIMADRNNTAAGEYFACVFSDDTEHKEQLL